MRGSSAHIDNILNQLDAEIAGSSRYVPPLKTHDRYGASHRPSDDAFDLSGGMSFVGVISSNNALRGFEPVRHQTVLTARLSFFPYTVTHPL